MKKIILARVPKEATEPDIESVRDELRKAINECQNGEIGLALIRDDVEIGILDLDKDTEYVDEKTWADDDDDVYRC